MVVKMVCRLACKSGCAAYRSRSCMAVVSAMPEDWMHVATNKALTTLLKNGPYKSYIPPNRYSILRVKASLKSVLEDLENEEEYLEPDAEPISDDDPYPFTYDGSSLKDGGRMPTSRYDVANFNDQSSVAVEVSLLGYQMTDKEPSFSFAMQGIYHLGTAADDTPSTPGKFCKDGIRLKNF